MAILLAILWLPSPAQAQGGENLRGMVKINYLKRTLSKESVTPGESFTGRVEASVTFNKPFNASVFDTVTAEYQILGRHALTNQEVVLGRGERTLGPFPDFKAGDRLDLEEAFSLAFPQDAEPGTYAVLVRPVKVSPWFLWLALGSVIPQEARLGAVSLAKGVPPTPIPPQVSPLERVTSLGLPLGVVPWVVGLLLLAALGMGLLLWRRRFRHP